MKQPTVTVIIPVYNAADTVEKCIGSVLAQTYRELEVLAVDDGSTDDSLAVLTRLAASDARLKVLKKANGGVSSARNLAINQSSGVYLQFVDSDDCLPADATENLVRAMEQPDCDLAIAPYWEVAAALQTERGFLREDRILTQHEFLDCLSEYPNSFYYAVLWNKLYRREIVIKQSIRCDDRLPWGEDFAFNTEYYCHVRNVAVLSTPVYYYIRNIKGLALTTARECILHPVTSVKVKIWLQQYYNRLFLQTGLYAAYRRILPHYLFRITINR
ncbi:MAG: glycosyltransferase family 2 protein [Eubacteriales bacterium]|nr:glycosyltransferase family 2 protein [Eubacteriales bacterium]